MECRVGMQVPTDTIEESYRKLRPQSFGWLRAAEEVRAQLEQLQDFAGDVRDAGFGHVVLLGMGGAALPAEVIAFAFGAAPGWPRLVVLDTTDPAAIAAVESAIEVARTLFVVADKTGQSLETAALHSYFLSRVREDRGEDAGRQFVAITDEGSALEWRVHQEGMSALFLNDDEVPDGFSALSYFGMLPAALAGVDIGRLLARARGATAAWRPDGEADRGPAGMNELLAGDKDDAAAGRRPNDRRHAPANPADRRHAPANPADRRHAPANPAVELGAAIAHLARAGRDKLTIVCSPGIGTFGSWIEGIVANSTGKDGVGVVPIDVEPPQPPEVYGDDRQFVYLRLDDEPDAGQDEALARLEEAGVPVHRLSLRDRYDLGAAFVLWEIAAATAAAALDVDPLAQPDEVDSDPEQIGTLAALEEEGRTRLPAASPASGPLTPDQARSPSVPPAPDQARSPSVPSSPDQARSAAAGPSGDGAAGRPPAADGRTFAVDDRDLDAVLCGWLEHLSPPVYVALQAWLPPANDTWLELQAIREALLRERRVATSEGFAPRLLPITGQLHKGGPASGVFVQFVSDGGPDLPVPGEDYGFARLQRALSLADLLALRERGRRVLRVEVGPEPVAGLRLFRERLERALHDTSCVPRAA